MNQMNLHVLTGWSALIHAVAGVLSLTTLMLFFARGGLWGPVNDTLTVIWALSLIPLAGWFFLGNRLSSPLLTTAAAVIGIGSMVIFALLQAMLVLGLVRYEQTLPAILTLTGAIGVWLILNGIMDRALQAHPPVLHLAMLAAGVGLLLSAVGFWLGGEQHPLAAAGFISGFIADFVWPAWLAWSMLAARTTVTQ